MVNACLFGQDKLRHAADMRFLLLWSHVSGRVPPVAHGCQNHLRDTCCLYWLPMNGNLSALCVNGIGPLVQSLLAGLKANAALRGILLMCSAALLFPFMNGTAKYLGTKYPMEEVIWIRILSHLVFVSFLFVPRYGLDILRSKRVKTQLLASAMLFLSTFLFFQSVGAIPLAEATAITFVGPLMVTVLAVPMLGEQTSLFRIICVICGFLGALLVIRPGTEVFHVGSLLVVASALLYSLYQITTRTLSGFDRPETTVIYSGIVGSLVMSAVVPLSWKTPESLTDMALMGSLGVIGGFGHYLVARALRITKASVIAPFHYLQIIFAVFYGYLVFNNLPDLLTVAGSVIISCAGIAICWLEIKASRAKQV